MINLNFKFEGLKELQSRVEGFSERRFRGAIATALTRTAKKSSVQWQDKITSVVDRPTARTQKATAFIGARADKLEAIVLLKDSLSGTSPDQYLKPQETGGGRRVKKFEQALINSGAMPQGYVAVPARAALRDAYGNVSRSLIIQVISQLGRDFSPGYQRVISPSASKRIAKQARLGRKYIAVLPGQEKTYHLNPGIYQTQPDGKRLAILLYKRSVTYRKRLDLLGTTSKASIQSLLESEIKIAIDQNISRVQAKAK
jgi:hypothetical protein